MRSLGERGARVRLFQKRSGGVFFRDVWVPGQGKNRRAINTTDRAEADRIGRVLLAELLKGDRSEAAKKLTLGELWRRFAIESSTYLDNIERSKKDAVARVKILLAFLGANCEVASLTQSDVDAFTRKRMAGGIRIDAKTVTRAVRARSAEADLVLLRTMVRWAMTVRTPNAGRLLATDPLFGMRRVREKNPKQPIASIERHSATRSAMQRLFGRVETPAEKVRWLKIELALVLAEATGRRMSSIRQLRWEDIDLSKPQIRWRAEADKKRKEWCIPIPAGLVDEIRSFQRRLGAVGGWVFSSETNPDVPMDRHLFDKWLAVAEREAGVSKLDGGLWHPYRRKWATERKNLPLKDVAAAGGWNDVDTLLKVYQQPDPRTLLAVMSEPRKVSETISASI
jgi:integrase